jgi:twinkle protein
MTITVMDWLTGVRKLDAVLLQSMEVNAEMHPLMGQAASFAYLRNGVPYATKLRAVPDKDWRATQGVSRGLYNEDCLFSDEEEPIVLTEGEIDCLSVMQAGFLRAVSLPDGWSVEGGPREILVKAEELLRCSPHVIVAGDNDEVGRSLPRAVANVLLGHPVRYAVWPDGCKDANDVLVQHGEEVLRDCLAAAKLVDPPGGFITGFSDLPPLAEQRVLRTGLQTIDCVVAFEVGAMSVVTGTPGSGKSTFTTFAAYHVAHHEKVRVGLLSFETHPHRTRDHLCRLHTGCPWEELRPERQDEVAATLDLSFRLAHRTYDDTGHNLAWLRSMIYTLSVRDGCKLIIIDPWNELEHLPDPGENMTAYINFALQRIRTWAEQFETHICVVAHPRKMPTDGKPRAPVGYDISDSAAFANKPSLGLTVHQAELDDGTEIVRLLAWKVRDTMLYGFEKGQVRLEFVRETMNYIKYEPFALSCPG